MAALSCYQPCRSHLAQPARCLDEEEERLASATLSLRRRQFVERCHEPRPRPAIPEVSVKFELQRTREELAKHAAQNLVNRRLNVESGWSKVEEVRKKFERAAAEPSYSRSFESPPRRRLADSLFASFKLPRKKDAMLTPRAPAQQKRKSAVEMLAESKAFYVKSETVLDRKQELPLRVSSGLSQAIAAGGCHLVSSSTLNNDCCNPYATTGRATSTRRAVSAGEGLQSTLRRLLGHADSRENMYPPHYTPHKMYADPRRLKDYPVDRPPGTLSGTSSSGSGSKPNDKRPLSFDARVFFPESFVIPRQQVRVKSTYSIPSSASSPENIELPEPVLSAEGSPAAEPIDAISPPAQYAHSAPRYIRSNSHSQPSMREEDGCTNINSHKSLPDLHTQARGYHEHRCGSSFARDSGGSSGHYTQHSAPPAPRPAPRDPRDSGCSTTDRYGGYYGSWAGLEECYVSAPPQFQDGAPSPPHAPPPPLYPPRVGIHFQASAPPPQFQDEPPLYDYNDYDCATYKPPAKCHGRKEYSSREPRDYNRYHESGAEPINKQPQYAERRARIDDSQEYVHTSQMCPPEEVTSPLGTFKRQRCLRYKQRRPRPILRSKSDISERYRRSDGRSPASAPCEDDSPDSPSEGSALQQFFERLGLEPRQYDALLRDALLDSPVFFSSASTVDSNQLANAADYTVSIPKDNYL
ncbi:uncharacterized protein LOC134751317 isoform X4 [Cydia strobilella]|uniref:uncharacterized protein LOC134751317 isoform X4 n=1 Tax=Cydia strobilella TaxID=1100964 RepID=UPI0030074F5E